MNVFELFGKLSLDSTEYDKGLDNAEKKGSSFASSLGKGLGTAAKVVGTASVAAVGVATTGITALTKKAVDAYGTYEQLVGGVKKIFGDSADEVMKNADRAFSTAGMSANTYMETVTSFSASLIQSLKGDTKKAVSLADTAIRDMSDNANTFGTDIKSIMNAYQGFSKQNYTMLDNLKLGYGGTKSEVERLIRDAEKLDNTFSVMHTKTKKGQDKITYGYADVVEAIHIVQQNMNITGTTAKEASDTIQGTAGSLKGAWDNLVAGLGKANTDLKPLINNVVKSALQLVNNIKPIALQAVQGIAALIEGFAPVLAEQLPPMIQEILPSLVNAVVLLINSLATALPPLVETLLPPLLQAAVNVAKSLLQALPQILQILSSQIPVILQQLIPAFLSLLPLLIQTGIDFTLALGKGLADNIDLLMSAVMSIIHYLVDELLTPENIAQFVVVSTQIILAIAGGLIKNIPEILGAIAVLISNIVQGLGQALPEIGAAVIGFIVDLGSDLGQKLYDLLGTTFTDMWANIQAGCLSIANGISDFLNIFVNDLKAFINNPKEYLKNSLNNIKAFIITTAKAAWDNVKNMFTTAWNNIVTTFNNIKNFIPQAIEDTKKSAIEKWEAFKKGFTDIFDSMKQKAQALINFIKKIFSGEIKLPKIKLPHFKLTGEFNLAKKQIPHLSVEWYKKAYDEPYILNGATIFGATGNRLLGGGESGSEVVVGTNKLMEMMKQAVGINAKPITINVYGAEGQDVRELAKAVSKEMQQLINDKGAVYA